MNFTPAQLQTLKTNVEAGFPGAPNSSDQNAAIAAAYNQVASPDYWVWRTSVGETEFTRLSGVDVDGSTSTNWSWTTFIGRSQGERDAWPRLFMGGGTGCNPSLLNVRNAFADIFSGAGGASQRTHLLALSRRKATRLEKLFATGNGAAATPSVMVVEGVISGQDIENARNS